MDVYLALGSNLGDSKTTLDSAIELIRSHPQITLLKIADYYRTAPVGYDNQADFINTAIAIETELEPHALLQFTQSIENKLGRVRLDERNGPRTIDIDIVLCSDKCINSVDLIVPHPRIAERRFVLQPLTDLNPELEVPGLGQVTELLAATLDQVVEPLNYH